MSALTGYIIVALLGALIWAHNWGVSILNIWRDWPVILMVIGVWGILREIFAKRDKR